MLARCLPESTWEGGTPILPEPTWEGGTLKIPEPTWEGGRLQSPPGLVAHLGWSLCIDISSPSFRFVTLLPLLSIRHAIPYVIMAVVSLSYWMGGGSCSLTLCSSAIVHCSRVGRRRELMNLLRSWPSELTRGGWGTPRPGASWWG